MINSLRCFAECYFKTEAIFYLKNHKNNVGTIVSEIRNIKTTDPALEGFTDSTKKLYDQTLDIETHYDNQLILWTFITIILIIMNYLLMVDSSSSTLPSTGIIWIVSIIILLIIGLVLPYFTISEKTNLAFSETIITAINQAAT